MLDVKRFLLTALFGTLYCIQVFRDHLEDLEKLTSYKLDLCQIVLLVWVAILLLIGVLNLDVLVLLLNELKPRSHIA